VEKISTHGFFRLHIYLHTNKTLMHNSLYVFDIWGENLSHNNIWYNNSTKMLTERVKPIQIIGDFGDLIPNKLSSTVLE
jgi:hypothetical protein